MLQFAGILIPVNHTAANGLPLGSEADSAYRKMLLLDPGLMLRLLNMTMGEVTQITPRILTASAADLIHKHHLSFQNWQMSMLFYVLHLHITEICSIQIPGKEVKAMDKRSQLPCLHNNLALIDFFMA